MMEIIQFHERSESAYRITLSKEILRREIFRDRSSCSRRAAVKELLLLLKQKKSKYYKTHSQSDSEKGQEIVRFSSADPRCRMKLHMVGI